MRLPDGRGLQVALWGEPQDTPLLLLHGTPHSRLFCPDLTATEQAGVNLITFDRAGYGRSDPAPGGPSYRAYVDDVLVLLDHLEIDRLAVIGWSGGGPHAMALGAHAADRVTSVTTVCSPSGPETSSDDPEVQALVDAVLDDPAGSRERIRDRIRSNLRDGTWATGMLERFDPTLFDAPAMREVFPLSWDEATAQSLDGYVAEWILGAVPWDFDVSDVGAPTYVWFGEGDVQVSAHHAHAIAAAAPDSRLFGCPECRHFVLVAHWPEIIDQTRGHLIDQLRSG